MRHRSFAQEQIMPLAGRNEKPDLYAVAICTKVRPYLALPRYRTAAKDIQILWKGFALRPGCDPEAQSLSRGYDYFFFFEVFFATFLVAALAVFFAFFAFLAMSSSIKTGSVNMRTPCIDMHNIENDITNAKLIPTSREVALESLAGGDFEVRRVNRRYSGIVKSDF